MGQNFSWLEYKLVTELSNEEYDDDNEQETSETKTEVFALKTDVFVFPSRSKAQSKTTKTYFCLLIYKNCIHVRKILDC